jgi:energy-coupling factor transport system substrate-specific component
MDTRSVFLASGCIALNLSLAKIAALLSLPVYLDSIGTILGAALLPPFYALAIGALTSLLGGVLINPYFAAYVGTQIAVALMAVLCLRWGLLRTWWLSVLAGILIAVVAVSVSAPITVILFGGITLSGTTAINAILLASGRNLWQSVFGGSLLVESLDKPSAALLASLILRRLPAYLKNSERQKCIQS